MKTTSRRKIVLYSGLLLGVAILIVSTRLNLGRMVRIMQKQQAELLFQSHSFSLSSSSSVDAAAQAARDIISSRHQQQQEQQQQEGSNDDMNMIVKQLRLSPTILQQQQQQQKPQHDKKVILERKQALTITALNETTTTAASTLLTKKQQLPQQQQKQQKFHLEFVHIPKTGGSAIEMAAKKKNIRWGAFHYNTNRPPMKRRFLRTTLSAADGVPYWHLPPFYYDSHDPKSTAKNCNTTLFCFDPHGPNPYQGRSAAARPIRLFTIVRDPYARVVSEYLFYHREVKKLASRPDRYNDAHKMNVWLSTRLNMLRRALISTSAQRQIHHHAQARYINVTSSSTTFSRTMAASKSKTTIEQATVDVDSQFPNRYQSSNNITLLMNTADEWRNWPFQSKLFRKAYYAHLGHFIPQYDYVYNGFSTTPMIHHVLHFENLHVEFAQLMRRYQLPVVLPLPKATNHNKYAITRNSTTASTAVTTTNSTTSNNKVKATTHQGIVDLVGVQNLTEANRRLIELIYARDFLAFGYPMMPPIINAAATATATP